MKYSRFLAEGDLHYLVIPFFSAILMTFGFGSLRPVTLEIAIVCSYAAVSNMVFLALSFMPLAPWSLTAPWICTLRRCGAWIAINYLVGTILTAVLMSVRILASLVVLQGG